MSSEGREGNLRSDWGKKDIEGLRSLLSSEFPIIKVTFFNWPVSQKKKKNLTHKIIHFSHNNKFMSKLNKPENSFSSLENSCRPSVSCGCHCPPCDDPKTSTKSSWNW